MTTSGTTINDLSVAHGPGCRAQTLLHKTGIIGETITETFTHLYIYTL